MEEGRMLAPKADVIIMVSDDFEIVLRCLQRVLEYSGPTLRRMIVIDDHGPESDFAEVLNRLAEGDGRVYRVGNSSHPHGFAGSCNRGLSARKGDAVLLGSDCIVSGDWLAELAAVAHSEERTACAAPLINEAGTCSVTGRDRRPSTESLDESMVRAACVGLPRWTVAPVLSSSCIYLRGDVIDAVGLLDPTLTSGRSAVDNWVLRAQTLGFVAKRANHAYVQRWRPLSAGDAVAAPLEPTPAAAVEQPHLQHQLVRFGGTLDGHLAAHAVQLQATGKLRVAYDLRVLPPQLIGSRTYAVSLAQALAGLPEIDLTLLVADPAQANGLKGRVVTEQQWQDDVAVIHKPFQVGNPRELFLLLGSSAHVVITYLDLIGYRIPLAMPSDGLFDQYRATSSLSLLAAQRILAFSENVANEIHAEFGIPHQDIPVVSLGVEAGWFAHREERDVAIAWRMGLPTRYFLSVATDYPHKNLPNLLDAYALLRSRWRAGEPPALLLAGNPTCARTDFYRKLVSNPLPDGLRILGPVGNDELRVLYQHAVALVYPTLYEGFGLPPLEAMAAGTPVIAMPISAVPEVVGDCVLYPDGLAMRDLAQAMEALATDETLREEFRARGLKRVEQFRWEETARHTCEVYRSTVLRPSDRSLEMRRHLRDAILHWGTPPPPPPPLPEQMGIRNSWIALNTALYARLGRELRRFRSRPAAIRPAAAPVDARSVSTSHDVQPAASLSRSLFPNPLARWRAATTHGSRSGNKPRRSPASPIRNGEYSSTLSATEARDV
jgi:glycosyltransferase involved in cell wall biosynthesis